MDKITNNCRQNAGNDLFTGLIKYGDRIEVQAICGQMAGRNLLLPAAWRIAPVPFANRGRGVD
jgi:hypothetical protein